MRVFEHPNKAGGWECPICKTDEDKEIILIGIIGTEEGHIIEAEQFHVSCLDLVWNKTQQLIFHKHSVR